MMTELVHCVAFTDSQWFREETLYEDFLPQKMAEEKTDEFFELIFPKRKDLVTHRDGISKFHDPEMLPAKMNTGMKVGGLFCEMVKDAAESRQRLEQQMRRALHDNESGYVSSGYVSPSSSSRCECSRLCRTASFFLSFCLMSSDAK